MCLKLEVPVLLQASEVAPYLSVGVNEGQEWWDNALLNDVVPTLGAVTRDVPQRPHRLLAHVSVGGLEELNQQRNSPALHHRTGLGGVP